MKIKIAILLFILFPVAAFSSQSGKRIVSQAERGAYVEKDIVTVNKLKYMPVPISKDNYALYQSIQKTSTVIIGNFIEGESLIILIQDNNMDEKPDIAAMWYPVSDKLIAKDNPDDFCPADKFKKLKEAIFTGKQEKVSFEGKEFVIKPNAGMKRYETLSDDNLLVTKNKQGLRVAKTDPDEKSSEMEVYSYSYNDSDESVDIAFSQKYFYRGNSRISPLINYGVYCSKSFDPFAKEKVKQLREKSSMFRVK